MPAAKPAKSKKIDRTALARELLGYEKKLFEDLARMSEIKSLLKGDANGENYKITVKGLGEVKVSAPRDKVCTGVTPELAVDKFLALAKGERTALIKSGVVVEAEQWKSAYYGSVTAELF